MKTACDIAIVGGGLNGMACALALARRLEGKGISLCLIDAGGHFGEDAPKHAPKHASRDGRASSIARASYRLLTHIGVADIIGKDAQPIHDILISDAQRAGAHPSPLTLHFDSADIARGGVSEPMGYMVENAVLAAALTRAAGQNTGITQITDRVIGWDGQTLTLEKNGALRPRLVIAADGRRSRLREFAGIKVTGWDYKQRGIVTTAAHELPHEGVAHELFLPSGPFAILPLTDDKQGRHRSSIVWTDSPKAVAAAAALPPELFEAELSRRFGGMYGKVTVIAPVQTYPLGLQMAKTYSAPRLALIGDAAHGVHPIAGQGLNMGLRDIAALADACADGLAEGAELGGAPMLAVYERWRRLDNVMLGAGMDLLSRLFSNGIAPVQHARRLGIAAIDRIRPARQFFMSEAAGELGQLPTLLR